MVAFNAFWQQLPNLGNHLISSISNQCREWIHGSTIPAFHSEQGAWVFRQGRIFLNNDNLETLVDHPRPHCDMTFWLGVCGSLKTYRGWYFKQVKSRKSIDDLDEETGLELDTQALSFEHMVHHLLGKVYRKIKRRYDETTDGLAFYVDEEGFLTINGIRVAKFLSLAHRYPTDKAKTFLKGLKSRLSIILSNKNGNPNYDKIWESSSALFDEIDRLIGDAPELLLLAVPETSYPNA